MQQWGYYHGFPLGVAMISRVYHKDAGMVYNMWEYCSNGNSFVDTTTM